MKKQTELTQTALQPSGTNKTGMNTSGSKRRIRKGLATGVALCLTSSIVLAQQAANAPPRLTFDLSSGLTYDDNPTLSISAPAPLTTLDTRFGLHLNTATRGQTLSFSLQGLERGSSGAGFVFRDPSADLAYKVDNGNAVFSVTGLYRQSPFDLFEPLILSDGSVSTTDLLATTGTVTTQTAGFSFETGLQRPLGFDLSGNYNARTYSETTSANVYDSNSNKLKAGVHLRLASGAVVDLTAGSTATYYQNTTQATSKSQDFSLGYSQNLRSDLKLLTSLGRTEATTRQAGVLTNQSKGLTGSLGLETAMPNGTASVTLSSTRDAVDPRQALSFGRSMDLPLGKLAVTAGVSARSGGAAQLVGTLSYSRILPADSFAANLSRQVVLNADDQDVANTVVGLTYQHKINEVSDFGLSLNLLATGGGGSAGVADVARQTLRATFSHDLTRDWQMTAGYQFRSLDQSAVGTADSNSVFLTVSRKFTLLR